MPLLDARDMCAEDSMARPDEQCILTYVSGSLTFFVFVFNKYLKNKNKKQLEFPPAFAGNLNNNLRI